MTLLNKDASILSKKYQVSACTDVTGFGLIGHLLEMINDKTSIELYSDDILYLEGALDSIKEFNITASGQRNKNAFINRIKINNKEFSINEILFDPQTSGGLLISMKKEDAIKYVKELGYGNIIGKVIKKENEDIIIW